MNMSATNQPTATAATASLGDRAYHFAVRVGLDLMRGIGALGRRVRPTATMDQPGDVLLTGTFHSEAWVMAFLAPLMISEQCRRVTLITTLDIASRPGLVIKQPPKGLRKVVGDVGSRLLSFLWTALREKPAVVGGFHISINALVAQTVAGLSGARSMYLCVGGPIEVIDGGLWGESRIFGKLAHADASIEQRLLKAVREFDYLITMGQKARSYFLDNGVPESSMQAITGGIDAQAFGDSALERTTDIVFVGRQVEIKCLDLLLASVAHLYSARPELTVRIVGSGPLKEEMQALCTELKLDDCVTFAGFVPSVADELKKAKIFALTSKSEGVSLAMIEAMLAGAVPVVADVGDLGDLVVPGKTGFLVDSRAPEDFSAAFEQALSDEGNWQSLSQAAHARALLSDVHEIANQWDQLLADNNPLTE